MSPAAADCASACSAPAPVAELVPLGATAPVPDVVPGVVPGAAACFEPPQPATTKAPIDITMRRRPLRTPELWSVIPEPRLNGVRPEPCGPRCAVQAAFSFRGANMAR